MSYDPSVVINKNPFFSSYRSTDQTAGIPGDFQTSNFLNCNEDSGATGKIKLTQKSFIIGELRASTTGTKYNLYDVTLDGTDELSEGYQVRCNATGTVLMDDSCYGFADVNDSICIRAVAVGPNSSANALANQIRLMGLKTK
tara:strand:- start:2047 stop:2472 length:426 start_codon:yes stop_codon:yes gene_type:complete